MATRTRKVVEERLGELAASREARALSNGGHRRLLLQVFGEAELADLRPRTLVLPDIPDEPTSPAVPGQPVNIRVNDPGEDVSAGQHTIESEPSLAASPPHIVASFNDSNPAAGFSGYSYSADAGAVFHDQGGLAPTASELGDGVVAVDSDGNFYIATIETFPAGRHVGVSKSTDHGVNFAAPVDASTTAPLTWIGADKEWIVVDTTGGAHHGNLYVAWSNFESNGVHILFARSTDHNGSWSAPVYLSAPGTNPHGAMPAVAPDGSVYVVWFDRTSGAISIRRSTDGGQTFNNPVAGGGAAATINLIPTTLNGGLRANSFPSIAIAPNGTVFIAYPARNGSDNADVFLIKSSDQGQHWSTPLRVNDDSTSTDQWMPSIAVASNGTVGVMFYDRRNDPANLNIDVYLALSIDGGTTFLPNQRITAESFPVVVGVDPALVSFYMGDYNHMVAVGTRFYMVWGDNRDIVGTRHDPDVFFAQVGTEDCYVRDSPADDGTVPSAAGQAWQSPDIDPAMNPSVFGTPNPITVTVHNFGPKDAANVEVQLFWADPATYIPHSAWHSDRFTVNGNVTNSQTIALVPANGTAQPAQPFLWDPPDPTLATENGHFCLLAQIQGAGDPLTYPGQGGWQTIERDNNLAVRNVHVAPMGTGPTTIRFLIGAEIDRHLVTDLILDLRRTPKHFRHELVLDAEVAQRAKFGHVPHHPEELKRLPANKRRELERERGEVEHTKKEKVIVARLPTNRVVHIRGLRLDPEQPSLAELRVERHNPDDPLQDGELRVTQQIDGHTVGGLLYLLRAERETDKEPIETD